MPLCSTCDLLTLQVLSKEAEFFGGDLLLSNQDELTHIRKEMEGWTDNALKVFGRHRGTTGTAHPDQKAMIALNEVSIHVGQYLGAELGVRGGVEG